MNFNQSLSFGDTLKLSFAYYWATFKAIATLIALIVIFKDFNVYFKLIPDNYWFYVPINVFIILIIFYLLMVCLYIANSIITNNHPKYLQAFQISLKKFPEAIIVSFFFICWVVL